MDRLWSPWRSQYISSFSKSPKSEAERCFLCDAVQRYQGQDADSPVAAAGALALDAANLVVHRAQHCFVIMNRYPYNAGHLMIVPNAHVGDLALLAPEHAAEVMQVLQLSHRVLTELYHPHGFNVGANLGRVAGAGVPDHIHFHIVPRWSGDTNFMPVLADIRVASESLETTQAELFEMFRRLSPAQ